MGTPYLGELRVVAFNFAPKGWAFCNGQLLAIQQNQALFALLGTQFGGNGQTNFALPNLQNRVMVGQSASLFMGEVAGEFAHTVSNAEMPTHNHSFAAGQTTANTSNPHTGVFDVPNVNARMGNLYGATGGSSAASDALSTLGGSQPHENTMPSAVLNVVIALQGIFPSQN